MDLSIYKPASTTADAIRIAIARARQDATAFEGRIVAAKAARDALLLGDDPLALKKAEAALTEARGDGERLEAIAQHLQVRLAAAIRQEKVDMMTAAARELSDANGEMNRLVTEHGKDLADLLARARVVWERQTSAAAMHRRVQTATIREFMEAGDTAGADEVAAGMLVVSTASEADLMMQMLRQATFAEEFIAAFSLDNQADKPGAGRMSSRRAAR